MKEIGAAVLQIDQLEEKLMIEKIDDDDVVRIDDGNLSCLNEGGPHHESQSIRQQVQYQMDESEASDASFLELTTKIGNQTIQFDRNCLSGSHQLSTDFQLKDDNDEEKVRPCFEENTEEEEYP